MPLYQPVSIFGVTAIGFSLYIPHNLQRMLHNCNRQVRTVVYQSCNIVLRHLGKLFLEDALEARQDNKTVVRSIVVDHAELNIASALFKNSGLFSTVSHRV